MFRSHLHASRFTRTRTHAHTHIHAWPQMSFPSQQNRNIKVAKPHSFPVEINQQTKNKNSNYFVLWISHICAPANYAYIRVYTLTILQGEKCYYHISILSHLCLGHWYILVFIHVERTGTSWPDNNQCKLALEIFAKQNTWMHETESDRSLIDSWY